MKRWGYTLLGLLYALTALTLGSGWSFIWVAIGYSGGLYWLFGKPAGAWSFLIGATIGFELLGSSHFGLYSLFCFIIWLLDLLFRERLRFTSVDIRFTIALFLELGIYLLFFGRSSFATIWLPTVILLGALTLAALIRHQSTNEPFYALN